MGFAGGEMSLLSFSLRNAGHISLLPDPNHTLRSISDCLDNALGE